MSLNYLERVDSLLSLLTLEEQIGLIAPDPSLGSTCFAHIHGIPRVDLPEYGWLVEVNTGVASECLGPEQCATTFVGPTGLGAAFNREMWAASSHATLELLVMYDQILTDPQAICQLLVILWTFVRD